MEEIWKPVKGFEGRYEISNHGRLMSINGKTKGSKIICPNKVDSMGYYNVSLRSVSHGVARKSIRIHQLVAEHFLIKPDVSTRLEIDHKDSNRTNNHVDNLRWLTVKQHRKISIEKGEHDLKGEKHHNSKLSSNDVLTIRKLAASGKFLHKDLAAMFTMSRKQIGDIVNRKNWGWLKAG